MKTEDLTIAQLTKLLEKKYLEIDQLKKLIKQKIDAAINHQTRF